MFCGYCNICVFVTCYLLHSTEDPEPRETLLHFCALLDLQKTAIFFLRKRGSHAALRLANKNGDLPKDVATAKNHYKLIDFFSE